jgi:hypothetical protein
MAPAPVGDTTQTFTVTVSPGQVVFSMVCSANGGDPVTVTATASVQISPTQVTTNQEVQQSMPIPGSATPCTVGASKGNYPYTISDNTMTLTIGPSTTLTFTRTQ